MYPDISITPERSSTCIWRIDEELKEKVEEHQIHGDLIDSDGVVIVCNNTVIYPFNYMGFEIWSKCNGTNSISDIVDYLYEKYDTNKNLLIDQTSQFIKDAEENGLLICQK